MNLSYLIARRYFFSKHKKKYINFISIISMLVVAVGTMALIVVLSVFNGMEDLFFKLHSKFNPDLKIELKKGKSFDRNENILSKIKNTKGVESVAEIIEDNTLLRYKQTQMVVTIKGVSDNYHQQTRLNQALLYHKLDDKNKKSPFLLHDGNQELAIVGREIGYYMSIEWNNMFEMLQFWYPKRNQKVNLSSTNPEKNFNIKNIFPAGVFSVESNYDGKYIFVPISFAERLLDYPNKRTSLEVKVKKESDILVVQKKLQQLLGKEFYIKTNVEQQAHFLRALKIEKLFMFITLTFILGVASFNIFFALMMLAIDKKKDLAILTAMGAEDNLLQKIFFFEGSIIAFSGAILGLFLGGMLCFLQQIFGFIPLGTSTTIVSSYPVRMDLMDFIYTFLAVVIITVFASFYPAKKAKTLADVKIL
jgi:lipoprotein-releasing system permease protein